MAKSMQIKVILLPQFTYILSYMGNRQSWFDENRSNIVHTCVQN